MASLETKRGIGDDVLRWALERANLPTLQMVLSHLTGDRGWLEGRFRPSRTIALDDNDTSGLPERVQAELRDAALGVLRDWREGRIPTPLAPSEGDIVALVAGSVGEEVPLEFGGMMSEEAGFAQRDVDWGVTPNAERLAGFRVLIIGAGVCGILAGIKLRRLGIPFVIVEKNDSVGGTWLENDYPGAGVDTPSHLYSYSFEPTDTWTRYFAKQAEILAYLCERAERYGVVDAVRFGEEVTQAEYDEASRTWSVQTVDGGGAHLSYRANFVVSSVGHLNRPAVPAIAGMDTFPGPSFHSARWRHDLDLTGKRVAVIGTGASAMQIVPAIAGGPAELLVFQRSPQWVAPNPNYLRDVDEQTRLLMAEVPFYSTMYRLRLLWMFNDKLYPSLTIDPDWPHPDRSINELNDKHRAFFTKHIAAQFGDRTDLLETVLPTYPPYGKRILMDNGWYDAITRDDVRLIGSGVERIEGRTLVTSSGEAFDADVIVWATGFMTKRMLYPIEFRGRGGSSLRELWGDDDATAYLGMVVPGFPNFLMTTGPNTALAHGGSMFYMAECQVNYLTRLLVEMIEGDLADVDCRQDVFDDYHETVDSLHSRMLWSHRGMSNWYRNAAGRVVLPTPFRLLDYWKMTHRPKLSDFVVTALP